MKKGSLLVVLQPQYGGYYSARVEDIDGAMVTACCHRHRTKDAALNCGARSPTTARSWEVRSE